jgi:hypothetical protein
VNRTQFIHAPPEAIKLTLSRSTLFEFPQAVWQVQRGYFLQGPQPPPVVQLVSLKITRSNNGERDCGTEQDGHKEEGRNREFEVREQGGQEDMGYIPTPNSVLSAQPRNVTIWTANTPISIHPSLLNDVSV